MSNQELRNVAAVLLKAEDNYPEMVQAVEDLYHLFQKAAAFDAGDEKNREDIHLFGGKAIGPVWAALCIKDILRTKRFLRGVHLGIQAALKKFAARPIHVVYAGTGPFATLAIPLTAVFSSDEVNFTFLEINPASAEYLKKIVRNFQADSYIKEIVVDDAATYQFDQTVPIHVVVSETMQTALKKEPQVAITLNLVPQMAPGGFLIPESITVEAVCIDPKKHMERMTCPDGIQTEYYRSIGQVFELDKTTPATFSFLNWAANPPFAFPATKLVMPCDIPPGYRQLSLLTHIRVFAGERLGPGDCSLTTPHHLRMEIQPEKPIRQISFQYQMGPCPGFIVEAVDSTATGSN